MAPAAGGGYDELARRAVRPADQRHLGRSRRRGAAAARGRVRARRARLRHGLRPRHAVPRAWRAPPARGAATACGMLVEQAAESFLLWRGRAPGHDARCWRRCAAAEHGDGGRPVARCASPGSLLLRPRRPGDRRGRRAGLVLRAGAVVAQLRARQPPPSWRRASSGCAKRTPRRSCSTNGFPMSASRPQLKRAVVAAEDAKFVDHEGFDWEAISKAIEKNEKQGKVVSGASTISQQLAKNLFLSGERSWLRKGQEAVITWMLETDAAASAASSSSTSTIAEWGEGVFGAEAAARYHFGITAAALSAQQAAFLAAILPSPRRYAPDASRPTSRDASRPYSRACRRRRFRRAYAEPGHCPSMTSRRPGSKSKTCSRTCDAVRGAAAPAQAGRGPGRPPGRCRAHDLVEKLVHKQHLAELRRQAREAAFGRHRLHPRSAADRRAPGGLGPGAGPSAKARSCSRSRTRCASRSSRPWTPKELVAAAETLEADEIADLAPDLPAEVVAGRHPRAAAGRARAAARGAVLQGGHGRRADGLRARSSCARTRRWKRPRARCGGWTSCPRTPTSCSSSTARDACAARCRSRA